MEDMKKNDDPHATVCPELSNHEIFEKWRVVDTPALSGDRLAMRAEFERDREESNRRYDYAFQVRACARGLVLVRGCLCLCFCLCESACAKVLSSQSYHTLELSSCIIMFIVVIDTHQLI